MKKWLLCLIAFALLGAAVEAKPRRKKKIKISKVTEKVLKCATNAHSSAEYWKTFRDKKALEKQNFVIDYWNLERMEDEGDMRMLVEAERLVPLPDISGAYYIDPHLTERTRFTRPSTAEFIEQFAANFYMATQADKVKFAFNRKTCLIKRTVKGKIKKIKISGLSRDRAYQENLVRRLPKGQAASEKNGVECQSSHLAGTTFDFSLKDLSREELCWVLGYLYQKQLNGQINAIWEVKNKVFHVMVFPSATFTDHIQ
ncbi:MAG: DUF5715 family protein [bacterium]|nr:DUF5715 family protein [bacterium]